MPTQPTSIRFNGEKIDCIILPHTIPSYELQTWRTQFAATQGLSEIVGSTGGRQLEFPIVLCNPAFTDREELWLYVEETLNIELTGQNGLVELFTADGSILAYPDCTCHGFAATSDPKPDEAGTLGQGVGRWFCTGVMRFMQLGGG